MVKNSKRINPWLIFFIMLVIAFGITSYSSSLVHTSFCSSYDSYAYRYMGMLIAKGGVPYIDAFDNKGPVLYIIEYLGYVLDRTYGVFLLELSFVFLFLLVQFRICNKFLSDSWSVVCSVASVSSLSFTFVGNMCEEYSLLFIAIGICVFVDYFVFDNVSWAAVALCGFSFGAVLLIRPNMVVPWCVFCLAVVINEFRRHKKFPFAYCLYFFLGFLIIFLPICFWLSVKGALSECVNDYILSNFKYIHHDNSASQVIGTFWSFVFDLGIPVYIVFLIVMIFGKHDNKNVLFNVSYIICLILTISSLSIKGVLFLNYAMIVSPMLAYPIASFIKFLVDKKNKKVEFICKLACFLCIFPIMFFIINNLIAFARAYSEGNPYFSYDQKVLDIIDEYSSPDDEILVLGYKCFYYVESDRLCSTKFFYQLNDNSTYVGGIDEVLLSINANLPKLVIVEGGVDWEHLFIYYDNYELAEGYSGIWILKD